MGRDQNVGRQGLMNGSRTALFKIAKTTDLAKATSLSSILSLLF